jgi:hypothetical protein
MVGCAHTWPVAGHRALFWPTFLELTYRLCMLPAGIATVSGWTAAIAVCVPKGSNVQLQNLTKHRQPNHSQYMFTYLSRQSKGDTVYATKTQTGSGCTALLILNNGTRWRQVVDVLSPRKNPGTHWLAGWLGPRASLGILKERKTSCTCQDWNFGLYSL